MDRPQPIDFIALTSAGIRELIPYQPGKPIADLKRELDIDEVIKMASNENALGPSPLALAAVQHSLCDSQYYPDGSGYILKTALAAQLNIPLECITLGCGSDNIIALLAQIFAGPGDEVLMGQYAWSVYEIVTHAAGAEPMIIPDQNWAHDLSAMVQAIHTKTKVIFLANPNNPTGTQFGHDEFVAFMQQIPAHIVVVLDEAYYEFADPTTLPHSLVLQQQYRNLVITRTFSKAYGLAGLRVGYSISDPQIANLLNRVRLPFNVSTPALAAATAALADKDHLERVLQMTVKGRQQLLKGFAELNLKVIPSTTNFFCVDFGKSAQLIYQALLHEGLIVRPLLPYQMPNHLRITVGLPEQNTNLLKALGRVLTKTLKN